MPESANLLHDVWSAISGLDVKDVASTASAIAAWIALLLGISNGLIAKRALALAREQDSRRQPKVIPYLANSYFVRASESRIFAYSISVTNPTDTDNSLARLELEVSYETDGGLEATIRLPATPELASHLRGRCGTILAIPQSVNAHQAVAGWLLFELKNSLLSGRKINAFSIVLEDSHGLETRLDPGLSRELRDEDTAGNDSGVQT